MDVYICHISSRAHAELLEVHFPVVVRIRNEEQVGHPVRLQLRLHRQLQEILQDLLELVDLDGSAAIRVELLKGLDIIQSQTRYLILVISYYI